MILWYYLPPVRKDGRGVWRTKFTCRTGMGVGGTKVWKDRGVLNLHVHDIVQ
jgi:hypothetical protein